MASLINMNAILNNTSYDLKIRTPSCNPSAVSSKEQLLMKALILACRVSIIGVTSVHGAVNSYEAGWTGVTAHHNNGSEYTIPGATGAYASTLTQVTSDKWNARAAAFSPSVTWNGPVRVQENHTVIGGTAAGTVAAAFAGAQTAGNTNIVFVYGQQAGSWPTVTDTAGNTYKMVSFAAQKIGDVYRMTPAVFMATNIASAGTGANTVTAAFSSQSFVVLEVLEYSGVNPTNPIDNIVTNKASSTALALL
jgi:hypothetical protein